MEERKIVVPGETIIKGNEFLPGDGTQRDGEDVVAIKYGLASVEDKLVRIIPLSGAYIPRRGNTIIGTIVDITFRGWLVDFGGYANAFLPLVEVPKFVARGELKEHFDFGDVISAKVNDAHGSVDLSVKMRGFGKLEGGQLMNVNPNKVPRVIGKDGSMVNLIKEKTGCRVNVGQNGVVWMRGESIEEELKARKIIEFICDNSHISGLTEKVEEFIGGLK
jgi:exosome complex component RRP4